MTRALDRSRDYVSGDTTWTVALLVTAPGPVGTVWTVSMGGRLAVYTTLFGDTTALVAEGIKVALNLLAGVTATRSSSTVSIVTTADASCGFDSDWGQAILVATEGRTLTITAPGATGVIWTANVAGQVAHYTVQIADTATLVATGLNTALNLLTGVTSTRVGAVCTVTYAAGAGTLVVTNDGAGTSTNVAVADPASTRTNTPLAGTPGTEQVYHSGP